MAGKTSGMAEFDNDPQGRPTDAERSHPSAGLPHARSGQQPETSSPADGVYDAGPVEPDPAAQPQPGVAAAIGDPGPQPGGEAAPAGNPGAQPGEALPAGSPGPQPQPAWQEGPGPQSVWQEGPRPQPVWQEGPRPTQPAWAVNQSAPQPAWAQGPAAPPWPPNDPQPGYPHSGYPLPWGAVPPQPRSGRIGKAIVGGVAVLALMVGSGIAGGAIATTLDDDNGAAAVYSAAPIINSADLPAIASQAATSVVSITTGSGEGSGVILTADGNVLTNNHVIADAGATVRVVFADGSTAAAKVVGTDPKTDLAVVKAEGVTDLTPAAFGDSDAMRVGDTVLALGSPLGLQGSVTSGIISARDRTIQAGNGDGQSPRQGISSISGLLQTDAPINPGNSGGALVNTRAEVIGINTAIATSGESDGNIGVGFAIPSNKAKQVAEQLMRGEKVSHPTLGVSVATGENGGAVVASVVEGSAAAKAGLQRGDVITRFGDRDINQSDDLVAAVQSAQVGDRLELVYSRNGAEARVTVTLAEAD